MALDFKQIRAVLFDMDGVLYRGDQPLAGVLPLWDWLESRGIAYACVTNNATRTPEQFATKLTGMGLPVLSGRIMTSSTVTGIWLREQAPRGTKIYPVGMQGLHDALFGDGYFIEEELHPDYVVVGADFEVTYAKLRRACLAIRAGARFIGTNPDKTFPAEDGIVPGCGALLAALEAATDIKPIVMGKPEPAMFAATLHQLGVTPPTALMVGDRLDTDIDGAHQAGLKTALVLTGVSGADEAARNQPPPDGVYRDLPVLHQAWQVALDDSGPAS